MLDIARLFSKTPLHSKDVHSIVFGIKNVGLTVIVKVIRWLDQFELEMRCCAFSCCHQFQKSVPLTEILVHVDAWLCLDLRSVSIETDEW